MGGERDVAIGYCSPGLVCGEWVRSLLTLFQSPLALRLGRFIEITTGPNLGRARNQMTRRFLESGLDWLLMNDVDMVYEPGDVERLLDSADPEERPIMVGLIRSVRHKDQFEVGHAEGEGARWLEEAPKTQGLMRVDLAGAGFLLVHRSVFERMLGKWGEDWWSHINPSMGGDSYDTDESFCMRAAALEIPIHCNTDIRVGHVKREVVYA